MKILLTFVLIGTALGASAQDVFITGGPGSYTPSYPSPVAYPSHVVYAAPVLYQVPVVYAPSYCAPAPNVIYFGGPCNYSQNYRDYSNHGYFNGHQRSQVIYFGRGQSYSQGYRFSHCR